MDKKIKANIIVIIILFGMFSCEIKPDNDTLMKLSEDKVILKIFSKEEIIGLNSIISYQNSIIKKHGISNNLSQSYFNYIDSYKKVESGLQLIAKIKNDQIKLDSMLISLNKNSVFSEIWQINCGDSTLSNMSVGCEMVFSPSGKYVQLLDSVSLTNEFVKAYADSYWNSGAISPTSVGGFYKATKYLNFDNEVHRLICAIHFITVAKNE